LTVISTFAGCGGSSLGYSMAGYKELVATDFWDLAGETFRLNFPKRVHYHVGDVCDLTAEELLEMAGLGVGELDVLDGSPPCQGFSTAGKRHLEDPRNDLFRQFVRLLHETQPRAFVLENVTGMVKGKMKLVYAEIMRGLKAQGYDVRSWVMDATAFGVPQKRKRVIFVGFRKDLELTAEPPAFTGPWPPYGFAEAIGAVALTGPGDRFNAELKKNNEVPVLQTGDGGRIVGMFPDGRNQGEYVDVEKPSATITTGGVAGGPPVAIYSSGFNEGEVRDMDKPSAAVMAGGIDGSGASQFHLSGRTPRAQYKPAPPLSGRALQVAEQMCEAVNGDFYGSTDRSFRDRPRDLAEESPAVPAHQISKMIYQEGAELRGLSIGEVMRLQSFPDEYDFGEVNWSNSWKMIGNSVPPLMMRSIAGRVRDILKGASK